MNFITLLILTNYFSEEMVGKYNYMNMLLLVLGAICLFGMNDSFLQFSGRLESEGLFHTIKTVYLKKVSIILILFAIVFILYKFISFFLKTYIIDNDLESVLDKTFIALFFYTISNLNYQVIRGLNKLFFSEVYRGIIRYGSFFILVILLILFENEKYLLDMLIFSLVLVGVSSTIFVFIFLNKLENSNNDTNGIGYKEILLTSFPMTISFFSLLIMQSMDMFVLKYYFDFKIIAYYGVAIKISMMVGIVLQSVNAIIAPKISEMYFSNKDIELDNLINKSIKINFLLTFPLIIVLVFFSKTVLGFFGQNYIEASGALIILLIGQLVNSFSGSVGVYLNMTGRQKVFQYILILSLILNLGFNLILIPIYGMFGAAISTAFGYILWNILGVILIYKMDNRLLFLNLKTFVR